MRTVTIPNKQIELTEAEIEQAVKDLARQKAAEGKETVPLIDGDWRIFPAGHPMHDVIQIRILGRYRERGLWLDKTDYDFALIPLEPDSLILTVTKKAETR